jgi:hypothetical protein
LHWTFPFLLARRLAAESSVCSARRTSVRTRLKAPADWSQIRLVA